MTHQTPPNFSTRVFQDALARPAFWPRGNGPPVKGDMCAKCGNGEFLPCSMDDVEGWLAGCAMILSRRPHDAPSPSAPRLASGCT